MKAIEKSQDYLKKTSDATAESAQNLNAQAQEQLAAAMTDFSNNVNAMVAKLRGQETKKNLYKAKAVAEENPALIIAGGLAIGVGLALLAKRSH